MRLDDRYLNASYYNEYSSKKHGITTVLWGLAAAAVLTTMAYVISVQISFPSSSWNVIAVSLPWLGLVVLSPIPLGLCYLGGLHLVSSKNWVVCITNEMLIYQSPHNKIAQSYEIPLTEIALLEHVVTYGSEEDEEDWFVLCKDGEKIRLGINTPFEMNKVFEQIKAANPATNSVTVFEGFPDR